MGESTLMTIQEYKELCKKDVLQLGQDVTANIKLGTSVKSLVHDDLEGDVVFMIEVGIMLLLNLFLLIMNF